MRNGILAAVSTALALTAGQAAALTRCDLDLRHPILVPRNPKAPKDAAKRAYRLTDGSTVFLGRLAIDADGSPKAYAPNDAGLDHLGNAGRPGQWWALATDRPDCGPSGTPLLQQAGDPAPGYYVAKTSMTAGKACGSPADYVDADRIPFVALPSKIAGLKADRGPLVVVDHQGTTAFAVMADAAPASGIGEGSMALARALKVGADPRHGGVEGRSLVYVVLAERMGFPAGADDVEAKGREAFDAWGGADRLAACRAALEQAPR